MTSTPYASKFPSARANARGKPDAVVRSRQSERPDAHGRQLEIGLRSIAVPVRDNAGKVIAAMNIRTHTSRVSLAEMEKPLLCELESAATELGASVLA